MLWLSIIICIHLHVISSSKIVVHFMSSNSGNVLPEKFITIDGHKIKYLDYNRQLKRYYNRHPILVLLHGLGASSERWLKVVYILSKYFRIIIPDIIGFGASDKPPTMKYDMDHFISFLQIFLEKLHIDSPIICGHSFGGQLAAEFAIRFHDQVEKLILTAPAGPRRRTTSIFYQYITAAVHPTCEHIYEAFKNMAFNPNIVTRYDVLDFKRRMNLAYAKFAFMCTLLGIENAQALTGRLSRVASPTLIVWGENDKMTPYQEYLREYYEIPEKCIQIINHCGHTPFVEKPINFNAILLKFLTGKDLYSLLFRQMTDDDREKEKNLHLCAECHQCAQCGCLVWCPPDRCLYDVKTFRIPKCKRCQGDWTDP
jgi:2-hydroxy-6-oxonona-2,4-dienedioate hydrolase